MASAFTHQVGGHVASITLSPAGASTVMKSASETELAFYQNLGPQLNAIVPGGFIGEWTPAYYGTLTLEGRMGDNGEVDKHADTSGEVPKMIVLENLTHRFVRPNVLDVKLGTQLYDEDATPEKQERMRQAALATTSATTGIRLTGFQNWNDATQAFIQTPKTFGKALTPAQLEDGLARFLAPFLPTTTALPSPPPAPSPPPPLDATLELLSDLSSRLTELESVLATLPIRMRGGSLLIVTEGHTPSLLAALAREDAALARMEAGAAGGDEEDSEEEGDGEEDDDGESVESCDSQGQALPHTCRSLDMRLIDFAHTRMADPERGEVGGDAGVLLGIRTMRRLVKALQARVRVMKAKVPQHTAC